MEPAPVVKDFDVIEDRLPSFLASFERPAIDHFLLEGAPERLHGGIVVAIAGAAHALREAVVLKQCAVSGLDVLRRGAPHPQSNQTRLVGPFARDRQMISRR